MVDKRTNELNIDIHNPKNTSKIELYLLKIIHNQDDVFAPLLVRACIMW